MFGNVATNNKRWEKTKLGNKSVIGSSKRIFANEYTTEGIPFYRSKEIIELGMGEKPSVELYISKKRYQEIKEKFGIPIPGDILMTAVGTIGKFWIVPNSKPFYYKDGNLVYIRTKEFNPLFLKKLLEMLIEKYKVENANGSAYTALTIEKLKDLQIVLPPMTLQKQYEEFHIQIDKSKFLLQQILEKLELLKKSRFIEMFKNSETLRLDQIAEVTMGQSPDSSSYNSVGKGIPFYQGKTEFTDKYIGQPSTWCTSPTRIAKENDILMSVRAPVGNVNIATEECCIGRGLSSIRPQNGFNSEFIFEALEQKKEELENKATGSTFKAINKDIVLSIQIPNTSISIQKEYSNFVKQIDKSKFNVFQDQTAAQVKVIVVLHHIC